MKRTTTILLAMIIVAFAYNPASAQNTVTKRGSDNMEVLGHLPLGPRLSVSDMDLEQEMSRPYAYISRMKYAEAGPRGTDIVDLSDPANPKVIYRWRIENQDLHVGTGAMDVKHFKWAGRYYVVQSLQFRSAGPDGDLGAEFSM